MLDNRPHDVQVPCWAAACRVLQASCPGHLHPANRFCDAACPTRSLRFASPALLQPTLPWAADPARQRTTTTTTTTTTDSLGSGGGSSISLLNHRRCVLRGDAHEGLRQRGLGFGLVCVVFVLWLGEFSCVGVSFSPFTPKPSAATHPRPC